MYLVQAGLDAQAPYLSCQILWTQPSFPWYNLLSAWLISLCVCVWFLMVSDDQSLTLVILSECANCTSSYSESFCLPNFYAVSVKDYQNESRHSCSTSDNILKKKQKVTTYKWWNFFGVQVAASISYRCCFFWRHSPPPPPPPPPA